jgi:tRNA threonylcarbamoyladenosine biosynthesis protein TsaE
VKTERKLQLLLPGLEHTGSFGRLLGLAARPGDVILLSGTLGAGKTTLTQWIALGLDVPADQYVTSPSFSLLHQYAGRIPLYHMDCYRLNNEDDVEGSGLMDYMAADGLTVVEWPDRLGSLRPDEYLQVELSGTGAETRIVHITAHGGSWLERMDDLLNRCRKAAIPLAE